MMKITFVTTALLMACLSFGQQKKTQKTPPPPPTQPTPIPVPKAKPIELTSDQKCFVYTSEEKRDSLVYVTENLLEYGWAGNNARMIITRFNYDPSKKQVEKKGYISGQSKSLQFINGIYLLEQGNLYFTPDKSDKFEKRTFKLLYNPKTKKLDYLNDENNNQYKKGARLKPEVSL